MGRPKADLPFGPETLLERVIRLVSPDVDDIVLAAAPGQHLPHGFPVVTDSLADQGPLPALVGALAHVRRDLAFVVACDTPLLQPGVAALLVELCSDWDAAVPVIDGVEMTTCAVYRREAVLAAEKRREASSVSSLRRLLSQLRTRRVEPEMLRSADPALLSFTPCNSPEEYQRALVLAGLAG